MDLSLLRPDLEPPSTSKLTDSQLAQCFKQPLEPNIPLTTVSVERAVADTTQASKQAVSDEARNGIILQTFIAQQKRPRC